MKSNDKTVRCELKRKMNDAAILYFEVRSLNLQGKSLNASEDWMVSTARSERGSTR